MESRRRQRRFRRRAAVDLDGGSGVLGSRAVHTEEWTSHIQPNIGLAVSGFIEIRAIPNEHRRRPAATRARAPFSGLWREQKRGPLTSVSAGQGAFSFMVGDTGFEPVTSSVSRKRATAAPIA